MRTKDLSERYPLDVALISKLQREEMKIRTSDLRNNLKINPKYERTVHEGHEVIMFNKKLFVPNKLREQMVNWYHHYLSHPGATRLAKTIQQSCDWPGLVTQTKRMVDKCVICKKIKKTNNPKYDKLPIKEVETIP